jgi:hypothetical protein
MKAFFPPPFIIVFGSSESYSSIILLVFSSIMIITTLLEKMKQSLSEILHGSVDFKKIKIKKKTKKITLYNYFFRL